MHTLSLGGQHSAAIAIAPSDVIEDAKEPVSSVTSAPRLLTWGFGEFGALGHGGPQPEHFPCQVASLNQHLADAQQAGETQLKSSRVADAPAVSAGGTHTLVRDVRGRVFACGREDGDGRLGVQRRDLDGSGISSSLAQVRYLRVNCFACSNLDQGLPNACEQMEKAHSWADTTQSVQYLQRLELCRWTCRSLRCR